MFKGKLVVLSLIAAALLCWQVMPASVDTANSGLVHPCSSSAVSAGGCWVVCPQGDGARLDNLTPAAGDATIDVTVKDATGAPIPGIPAADLWVLGCTDGLTLCGGAGAINANAATDVNGETSIVNVLFGGGCDDGVVVVVQGSILLEPDCVDPLCLDILVRSPDYNGDLVVQALDFTDFGNSYEPLLGIYDPCTDYDCNGAINSLDFTVFGNHWAFEEINFHRCH